MLKRAVVTGIALAARMVPKGRTRGFNLPMNRNARCLVWLVALSLAGCIEEFKTPLDPSPLVPLDPRLIGVWACVPTGPESTFRPKGGNEGTFAVLEFGASGPWYRIRTVGLDVADREQFFDAYPSTLGDRTILNAWPSIEGSRKKDARVTFFAQHWSTAERFQFDLVMSKPLEGSPLSPASALRRTLEAHARDAAVFQPWLDCTRARVINSSTPKKKPF